MRQIIAFYGAKGGQGTTVTAARTALALGHLLTQQVIVTTLDDNDTVDLRAALGAPLTQAPSGSYEPSFVRPNVMVDQDCNYRGDFTYVVDCGTNEKAAFFIKNAFPDDTTVLTVQRGPCFIALKRLVNIPYGQRIETDGVILITEEGRSLNASDVEAATGLKVVATIEVKQAIARAVDAGLLARRTLDGDSKRLADITQKVHA
jgi:hypothetical protein